MFCIGFMTLVTVAQALRVGQIKIVYEYVIVGE
jgi:hypothetical protein